MLKTTLAYAARSLLHSRSYALTAIATLGLGLGATLAVFSVVEAVLLRPLPYANADRIVMLNHHDNRTGITKPFVALGDVIDIGKRSKSFEAIGTYGEGEVTVTGLEHPFRAKAVFFSAPAFAALDMRPMLGRGIRPVDSEENAAQVVMLSHRLWREKFRGDPGVIGRSLRMGPAERTIIGVAPPGWALPPNATVDLILSLPYPSAAPPQRRAWVLALGKLKPSVSRDAAAAEVTTIASQLEREFPATNKDAKYFVVPMRDQFLGHARMAVLLLFASVGVVFLIALANVSSLVVARTIQRRRDLAIRLALGAGQGRLASQLLAEHALIAAASAVVGLLIARFGAIALVASVTDQLAVPGLESIRLNWMVAGVAIALTIATTLVLVIVELGQARAVQITSVLAAGVKASHGRRARRMISGVVTTEMVLAVVLLFAAGLVIRSFAALVSVNPGFSYDQVALVDLALPAGRYATPAARAGAWTTILAAVGRVPGAAAVGAAAITPLTGNNWTHPLILPDAPTASGERPPEVGWQIASQGYFRALGIPLLEGRLFDDGDRPGGRAVVVISDALAKRYFKGGRAVGRQVRLGAGDTADIVGVVGSVRRAALSDEPAADMYLPFERTAPPGVTLFVRTAGSAAASLPSIQAVVRQTDPGMTISEPTTLASVASASIAIPRLMLGLLSVFAAIAIALAMIGVYGIAAYTVQQQSREIGTRIALGAQRVDIYRLFIGRSLKLALIGAVVGLGVAAVSTKILRSMLYASGESDNVLLLGVVGLLIATTVISTFVPARRAAGLNPVRTLSES